MHGHGWTETQTLLADLIDGMAHLQRAVYRTAPPLPKGAHPPNVPKPKPYPRPGAKTRRAGRAAGPAESRVGDTSNYAPGQAKALLDRLKPKGA